MIDRLPPGTTARHVEHASGSLRVLRAGEPRPGRIPIVLLHGGGSDAAAISWHRLMAPLGADRETWAIDLPGFGGSIDATPVGGPDALADVVADVTATLGIERAAVAGVSMGGDVALTLALTHPARVATLVAIAPGGLVGMLSDSRVAQRSAWAVAQLPDRALLPAARLANRFVRTALRRMVHDPATLPDAVVEAFVQAAQHPRGALGYLRYNQATLGPTAMRSDLRDRVHAIAAPTLLFHGDRDGLVPIAGSRTAAERMPDARLVVAPDCGHWAQLEAHDLFLAEVRAFLARVDER